MNLAVFRKQIEPVGIAARADVKIDIVTQASGRNHGVLFVLGGQLRKGVVGLGIDDRPLLDPAHLVLLSFDFQEATPVLEYFELLAVRYLPYSIRNSSHAIVQIHLACGNVYHLVLLVAKPLASTGEHNNCENKQESSLSISARDREAEWDLQLRQHSQRRSSRG